MSPAAKRALPRNKSAWTVCVGCRPGICRQLCTLFSTRCWDRELENPYISQHMKNDDKAQWDCDGLYELEHAHGVEEDLGLLVVGEAVGDVADGGV